MIQRHVRLREPVDLAEDALDAALVVRQLLGQGLDDLVRLRAVVETHVLRNATNEETKPSLVGPKPGARLFPEAVAQNAGEIPRPKPVRGRL